MSDVVLCGIYSIKNTANGKLYIGQAKNISSRWKTHIWKLNTNRHHNRYLQSAWNKYGADSFVFSVVCLCEEQSLETLEVIYIAELNSYVGNFGYNLTTGGEGTTGHTLTDDVKKHIGSFHKGKTLSRNHIEALSEKFTSEGNPFYGRHHTDITKRAISKKRIESGVSSRGNNIKAKPVIFDGIYFDCAQDCADFLKVKSGTLRSWIRGNRPMPERLKTLGLSFAQ